MGDDSRSKSPAAGPASGRGVASNSGTGLYFVLCPLTCANEQATQCVTGQHKRVRVYSGLSGVQGHPDLVARLQKQLHFH